jgi:hypothetical protein
MTELIKTCDDVTPICEGCDQLAARVGLTLRDPHVSCRKVTVTNLIVAAHRMSEMAIASASMRALDIVDAVDAIL